MASQKRTEIWNALLDAEMNEIYWSGEARRYGGRDRYFAAATAILSSGTTIALFSNLSVYPAWGKAIASLTTIVSVIHATYFHTGRLKQVTALAARWKEMAIEYKLLWAELEDDDTVDGKLWKEYETISRREKQIDESAFKIDDKRLKLAHKQVRTSRGLP